MPPVILVRPPGGLRVRRTGILVILALLLLSLPAGAARAEAPPAGTDLYGMAAGGIELEIPGVGRDFVRLTGMSLVKRDSPVPSPTGTTIATELAALQRSGVGPVFGTVKVTVQPGTSSDGLVHSNPGPPDFPADSFFDVFVDVSLPDRRLDLHNTTAYRIGAVISSIPWIEVFTNPGPIPVPLIDAANNPTGSLTHLAIDFRPRLECLPTQAQMSWTLQQGTEVVQLSGRSNVVHSDSFDPGDGLGEFNSLILVMDLSGTSTLVGPLQYHLQPGVGSPGKSKMNITGTVDSFFDVFFEIHDTSFDNFFNSPAEPLKVKGTNPPPGLFGPFNSTGPVRLFNAPGGGPVIAPVGVLNSFNYFWSPSSPTVICCVDADGDGVLAPPCGTDCDDHDPTNFPGNIEVCTDGHDNNCNQLIDCRDPFCTGRDCNDGNQCTRPDVCTTAGTCSGPPVDCDDHNPCTKDSCDPQTGQCQHQPADCDDGNPCTIDRCVLTTGQCEHVPVVCDDGNQCTSDACDPTTGGCRFIPMPGAPCDDGNGCTSGDTCVLNPSGGIACQGTPVGCADNNPCTLDECDPHTGTCLHVPVNCDDGNSCTADACDPSTGQCVHRPIPVQEPGPIKFRDEKTILWAPTPDAAHWNTYRGTIPAKNLGSRLPGPVYDQTCFESDDSFGDGPTLCTDSSDPPLGTAYYYLVSGESVCGESEIGHPSAPPGAFIPNSSPCPTPP